MNPSSKINKLMEIRLTSQISSKLFNQTNKLSQWDNRLNSKINILNQTLSQPKTVKEWDIMDLLPVVAVVRTKIANNRAKTKLTYHSPNSINN